MSRIPTRDEILQWISGNPARSSGRDIARAFDIKGAARIELGRLLKELEADGHLQTRRRSGGDPDRLPSVSVLQVLPPDSDGDLFAQPLEWHGDGKAPTVLMIAGHSGPAPGAGERILARLTGAKGGPHQYEGRLIRRIGAGPTRILGVFRKGAEGGRIVPIDKKSGREWTVAAGATLKAKDGELVEAERAGAGPRMGLPAARIVRRLGDTARPGAVSLIAIHQHGIPDVFPDEAMAEADRAVPAPSGNREDLRDLPLFTIDPADARDHDDACHAHPDDDPENPGGHVVWVAIADVAHYVRPGSALDREARQRGNSTYFPDRVVPMLPDRLSGGLCSLHEGVPRACIAVRMVLNAQGHRIGHRFTRGLMKSVASLNYHEVQAAMDGRANGKTAPLVAPLLRPLYAAYEAAGIARAERQPLGLDLPERRIVLDGGGGVASVDFRDRLDAHRLIEEFMVLANVAAGEELIKCRRPLLFRVHEEPGPDKLDALRKVVRASGFVLARGQVLKTGHLNRLLEAARGTDHAELINMFTLRSMTQAYYSPENHGHFGLALRTYAHFTSPIRRYADLIVHRALIASHGWGADGLTPDDIDRLPETAVRVSASERRSMAAERDTADRHLAAWLAGRVGDRMTGRVSGIAKFGLFVRLADSGADALVPIRSLGAEYFRHDPQDQTLTGSDSGVEIRIGQTVTVRLAEAAPLTGGLIAELLELDGRPLPHGAGRRTGNRSRGRKAATGGRARRKVGRKRPG